jgi:hypothetical protein
VASLCDPMVTARAREVVFGLTVALRLRSVQLAAPRTGREASKDEMDERFGPDRWWEHKGRLFWIEDDQEIQLAAAREILSRAEPSLNRVDARIGSAYSVVSLGRDQATIC